MFEALFDVLILGKSPIKWRQRPDMTIAVDWNVKHQFKQTHKQIPFEILSYNNKVEGCFSKILKLTLLYFSLSIERCI